MYVGAMKAETEVFRAMFMETAPRIAEIITSNRAGAPCVNWHRLESKPTAEEMLLVWQAFMLWYTTFRPWLDMGDRSELVMLQWCLSIRKNWNKWRRKFLEGERI